VTKPALLLLAARTIPLAKSRNQIQLIMVISPH
jgi:hypothetical protein